MLVNKEESILLLSVFFSAYGSVADVIMIAKRVFHNGKVGQAHNCCRRPQVINLFVVTASNTMEKISVSDLWLYPSTTPKFRKSGNRAMLFSFRYATSKQYTAWIPDMWVLCGALVAIGLKSHSEHNWIGNSIIVKCCSKWGNWHCPKDWINTGKTILIELPDWQIILSCDISVRWFRLSFCNCMWAWVFFENIVWVNSSMHRSHIHGVKNTSNWNH